jgi:hypothetical protein
MALKCLNRENLLPSKGTPGDVFYVSATKATYLTVNDGSLLNLSDLLSGATPHVRCVGPAGEQGIPGRDGTPGRDAAPAKDGRDSNIPGPPGERGRDGQSIIGPKGDSIIGPQGRPGRDGTPGSIGLRGERGEKGDTGATGPRGDVCIVGEGELQDALKAARQALIETEAKWLAAVQRAYEKNSGRPHAGLKAAVDNILRTLENDAR